MNQPEQYSKNNRMQSDETSRLLNKYLHPEIWKRKQSILEVGTGDGKYTIDVFLPQLPDNFQRYVATDISKEMVHFAKKKYSKEKYPKVEFVTLDCQAENISAKLIYQFDLIVSFFCFHWFTNASTTAIMNQPEQYSKNSRVQSDETSRLLNKYLDPEIWKRAHSILEVGSGDGKYTTDVFMPQLPDNFQRYIAIDISETMVDFARKKYDKKKYPKIEFITLDCQAEKIPANLIYQFDFVVSFFCFHWFTNARKAIENIFNVLKHGGEVIATFLEVNPLDDIFVNLSKHPRWGAYGHAQYVSNFSTSSNPENSWKDVFTETGFVIIKKFREPKTVEYHEEFEVMYYGFVYEN